MQPTFDSPFYRVTAKALIFDDQGRILVLKTAKGRWELPGGGWEHDETFAECLAREIQEELGVNATFVGPVRFVYRGHNGHKGYMTLRLVADVQIDGREFMCGDDMRAAQFVDRATFMGMDWVANEGDVLECIDQIWPEPQTAQTELSAAA